MKVSRGDFELTLKEKVEWFGSVNSMEDNKLREYATNASRSAFKKVMPISTIELWNII